MLHLRKHPARWLIFSVTTVFLVTVTWFFNQGSDVVPVLGRPTSCTPLQLYDYCTLTHPAGERSAVDVLFSQNGQQLISAGGQAVIFWEVASGRPQAEWFDQLGFDAHALTPAGDQLVSAKGREIHSWPLQARVPPQLLQEPIGHLGGVGSLAITADGRWLVSGGVKKLLLWDLEQQALEKILINLNASVQSVALAPDGGRLGVGNSLGQALVYDMPSGAHTLNISHDDAVVDVAFSADGARLLTASLDKKIRIWNAQSGAWIATLAGHEAAVLSLDVSADGRWLASAGRDGVKLWQLPGGKLIDTLETLIVPTNVKFSPDGTLLAVGGLGDSVRVWRVR